MQSFEEIEQQLGGRPKKEDTKVRLTFYVNQREHMKIKALCKADDISLSALMRQLVLEHIDKREKEKVPSKR